MMENWANPGDIGLDALLKIQRSLTVNLIMAPRDKLFTCRSDQTAIEVMAQNEKHFSFLPVVDDNDRILGLYDAQRWFVKDAPEVQIQNDYERFSEEIIIGADASIIDFVKVADKRPTRLVVSGDCVAGLVSLSDLQQLPVRVALFTLLTRLEMAMAQRIEKHFDSPENWLAMLKESRRKPIEDQIDNARVNDNFVSEIALSQLVDKVDIIVKEQLLAGSKTSLREKFKTITNLRNPIAHASHYAGSAEEAFKVCRAVRSMLSFLDELSD